MAFYFDHVLLEVKSADIPAVLRRWRNLGIIITQVDYIDPLTVHIAVSNRDYMRVLEKQDGVRFLRRYGMIQPILHTVNRPVFLCVLLILVFLGIFLPTRILFVQVNGNENIPANYILEQADVCGIRFWASRKTVRSEQVKNALLERIPGLKWAAVTTSGCTATVHIKEDDNLKADGRGSGISSIVAACDGVIKEITVTNGTPLCKVGDAVVSGQVLVSGYTDCGLTVRAGHAEAEIYAVTQHSIRTITIPPKYVRGDESEVRVRYYVRVGKKLIKLFKDSGISDDTCVKIYSENSVHLPGGFVLPVTIIQERQITMAQSGCTQVNAASWLEDAARKYLDSQMQAGNIIGSLISVSGDDNLLQLDGTFYCTEMIGLRKSEEIIQSDAKSD